MSQDSPISLDTWVVVSMTYSTPSMYYTMYTRAYLEIKIHSYFTSYELLLKMIKLQSLTKIWKCYNVQDVIHIHINFDQNIYIYTYSIIFWGLNSKVAQFPIRIYVFLIIYPKYFKNSLLNKIPLHI